MAKINKVDFSYEFPLLEIYARANKFSGFTGCNRLADSSFFEKEKLRFINLVTTKMVCKTANKETVFKTGLKSTQAYKIENYRLILSNQSGIKLYLKNRLIIKT